MHFQYGIMLLLCHFLQIIMSVLCFLEMIKLKYFINGSLREKFVIYYNETVTNKTVQDEVDRIQKEVLILLIDNKFYVVSLQWNCCGYRNVTQLTEQLPDSCCENKEANCTKNEARTDECKRAAGGVLRGPLKAAGTLGIIFALFEVASYVLVPTNSLVLLFFSFSLLCGVSTQQKKNNHNTFLLM